jgi:phosphatidate cytidylyltransferase
MIDLNPSIYSLIAFVLLTIFLGISYLSKSRLAIPAFLKFIWVFFLAITVSEWFSFAFVPWILAVLSFCALREFFSLVDIRLEDRWGILVSYLSIPCMFYLVQINWYGFFIIAIPVYTFLIMPFFVALGNKPRGIVFSVGVLDFGLFFYVFCMGHICYLIFFSERMAMLMILAVTIADFIFRYLQGKSYGLCCLLQIIFIIPFYLILTKWSGIPLGHCVALGIIIPVLSCMGQFTLKEVEQDLGIRADRLQPGRGRTIDALKSYLFTAPVVFHYLRWFLKWGDI